MGVAFLDYEFFHWQPDAAVRFGMDPEDLLDA
jgi:hypothetical protein